MFTYSSTYLNPANPAETAYVRHPDIHTPSSKDSSMSLSPVLSCIDDVSSDTPSDSSKLNKRSKSILVLPSDSPSFPDTPSEGYVVGVRLGPDKGGVGRGVTVSPAKQPQRPLQPYTMATQGFSRIAYLQLRHFLVGASLSRQVHVSFFFLPVGSIIQ